MKIYAHRFELSDFQPDPDKDRLLDKFVGKDLWFYAKDYGWVKLLKKYTIYNPNTAPNKPTPTLDTTQFHPIFITVTKNADICEGTQIKVAADSVVIFNPRKVLSVTPDPWTCNKAGEMFAAA